ncbi:MAG: hypothetical protein D3915_03070 [Candidatus Electrothrix sp. AU1_5]|nr:hypothetical protein [Candidatus Electrothrix gigas]
MQDKQIDIMVPVARKDLDMLEPGLKRAVKYITNNIRHIYVVWQGPENENDPDPIIKFEGSIRPKVIFVDERTYDFSLQQVKEVLVDHGSSHNHGNWYFQQLLKMTCFRNIPGILPRVLIHDCDIAFNAPINFLDEEGRGVLSIGYPFRWVENVTSFDEYGPLESIKHSHIDMGRRLLPGWDIADPFSGMHHHQLIEQELMESLLRDAEQKHDLPFWEAFLRNVDPVRWNGACEYVLYYHYVQGKFPDRVKLRHISGVDLIHDANEPLDDSFDLIADHNNDIPVLGRHGFTSLKIRLQTMDYIPPKLREKFLDPSVERMVFRLELKNGILRVDPC